MNIHRILKEEQKTNCLYPIIKHLYRKAEKLNNDGGNGYLNQLKKNFKNLFSLGDTNVSETKNGEENSFQSSVLRRLWSMAY